MFYSLYTHVIMLKCNYIYYSNILLALLEAWKHIVNKYN